MADLAQPDTGLSAHEPLEAPELALVLSPRQLLAFLVGYFALQVLLRAVFSSSVDLDESEQVVLAQKFSLGYGSEPPLYTWLQIPFFGLFGESVFALSLLKNLLLLSTYWLTCASARLVTRSSAAAVAAAMSLLFLPEVAWESQRDLTHSVLSATLAVATLFSLLRLWDRRTLPRYVWFGLCAGLGLISKYNYAFWLLGLVIAAASMPQLRGSLLDRRILLSVGIALLIFLPNGCWMLTHRELALLTSSKFQISQSPEWFRAVSAGLKNILHSLVSFATPLAVIYLLLFVKAPRRSASKPVRNPVYRNVILRAWLSIALFLVLLVCCARATGFKERWFQPILICLPIVAISLVQNRLDLRRLRFIAGISAAVMVAVAVIMPGRLLMAERLHREEPLTRPYATLAGQIRAVVPAGSMVVCERKLLAGNLRLGLSDATFITPELSSLFPGAYPHCFLAWETKDTELPSESLRRWAADHASNSSQGQPPRYFSARYKFHKAKEWRLGLVQLY